jgi:hypothetical protein
VFVEATSGHPVVRGVVASGCTSGGFSCEGPATFIDCVSTSSTNGYGFSVGTPVTLERCQANLNEAGFVFAGPCLLRDCRANGNTAFGFAEYGDGVVKASDCVSSNNGQMGFILHTGAVIGDCLAFANTWDGFNVGDHASITNCQSRDNGINGYTLGSAPSITGCGASGNHADGFNVGGRATFVNCQSSSNTLNGFVLASDSSILDSTASDNGQDGIVGAQSNRVRRCSVRGSSPNGQYGIHLTNSANFIEGNSVIAARVGIQVDIGGNKLIRNVCSANLNNWYVQTGNYCYVLVGQATAGQISGNAGGTASGATDPDANFSY